MSVIGSNALAGASGQAGGAGYVIEKSLRFNSGDSAYLDRTPSSAGNRKTWTLSFWVKNLGQGTRNRFHFVYGSGNENTYLDCNVNATGSFQLSSWGNYFIDTTAKFRDPSAWYHFVVQFDTTNSTDADRRKLWVNGVEVATNGTAPTLNGDYGFNNNVKASIGSDLNSSGNAFNFTDCYLAEYHFIDGQALDHTSFGAFDDNGVWQAAEYTGTYGTNGFHLFDFANETGIGNDSSGNDNDFTVNNLSVDTASLNVNSYSPTVTSTLYGGTEAAVLNSTNLNDYAQIATPNYGTYFWQLELSTSIPITSSVKINMESGGGTLGNFVVRLNDNSSTDTSLPVTGGRQTVTLNLDTETSLTKFRLSSPSGSGYGTYLYYIMVDDVVLTKGLISTANHDVLRDSPTNGDPANDTEAGGVLSGNYCTWNPLTLWNGGGTMELVDGNLNFGDQGTASRYGSIAGSIAVNSGKWFVECTLGSGTGLDSTVYFGLLSVEALATLNAASYFNASGCIAVKGNAQAYKQGGFTTDNYASGIAVGDTLSIAFNCDDGTSTWYLNGTSLGSFPYTFDSSKSWTPFASDWSNNQPCSEFILNCGQRPFSMTPPAGYKALCTANLPTPDVPDGSAYFDAKLYDGTGAAQTITGLEFQPDFTWIKVRDNARSHFLFDSVRGATEYLIANTTGGEVDDNTTLTAFTSDGFSVGASADVNRSTSAIVSWNWDAGTSNTTVSAGGLTSSLYNQDQVWSNFLTSSNGFATGYTAVGAFNGTEDTGGGSATNGTGGVMTFAPTSALSVSTMDIRVYSDTTITFPDSSTVAVDGQGANLGWISVTLPSSFTGFTGSNSITLHNTNGGLQYFDGLRINGKILADSNVSLSVPSIASTYRANPSAGFSVVTYTGNGTAGATVGHGLNAAPELILVKRRDTTSGWRVYHSALGATQHIRLDSTAAAATSSVYWNDTEPTSNVFSIGNNTDVNATDGTFVAYCFSPVSDYSAFGSYTTGGTNEPFLYLGFRPRFILYKYSSTTGSWAIWDTERSPYNVADKYLLADASDAEATLAVWDILSNGLKPQTSLPAGNTLIYAAFAENPFQANGGLAR